MTTLDASITPFSLSVGYGYAVCLFLHVLVMSVLRKRKNSFGGIFNIVKFVQSRDLFPDFVLAQTGLLYAGDEPECFEVSDDDGVSEEFDRGMKDDDDEQEEEEEEQVLVMEASNKGEIQYLLPLSTLACQRL